MWNFIFGVSLLVMLPAFVIGAAVFMIRRRPVWKWLAGAGISLALAIVSAANMPPPSGKTAATFQSSQATTAAVQQTPESQPASPVAQSSSQTLQEEQKSPVALTAARVASVVDGDTIHVSIDGRDETVRLIGVDTPETHHPTQPVQPYGVEAEKFTRSQLEGRAVYLEKDVQERDKYGRLLAYVWTDKPTELSDHEVRTKMFNARLLLDGYAQLLTIPPNVKYVDYFRTYQTEAREGNKGLWALGPVPNAPPSSVQAAPTTSQVQDQKKVTVYVTRTGKKYHRDGCRYLAKSKIPMSLSDAKAAGYGPCSVCDPPK